MPLSPLFGDDQVDLEALRQKASVRWAAYPADVIPLTAAELDFPASREITSAVQTYAASGNFFYENAGGRDSLKQVLAEVLRTRHHLPASPGQILLTLGTTQAIYLVVQHLCGEGDECILMDPVDPWFGLAADAARARRVYWRVDPETGQFEPSQLRKLITPRTRLITFCNPQNPLGLVMTDGQLRAIGEIAIEHGLTVMSDEVWNELVYPPHQHVSLASLGPEIAQRTFTLYGPSKTFGIPGLRVGSVLAPAVEHAHALMRTAERLGGAQGHSGLAQAAVETAYRHCWYWRDAFLEHLQAMRDYCVERVNRMPGISCRLPQSTSLLWVDISATGMGSQQFADFLLERARVAVVPGTEAWFGPAAEGSVRLCFSTSKGILKEALDRIERALSKQRP